MNRLTFGSFVSGHSSSARKYHQGEQSEYNFDQGRFVLAVETLICRCAAPSPRGRRRYDSFSLGEKVAVGRMRVRARRPRRTMKRLCGLDARTCVYGMQALYPLLVAGARSSVRGWEPDGSSSTGDGSSSR